MRRLSKDDIRSLATITQKKIIENRPYLKKEEVEKTAIEICIEDYPKYRELMKLGDIYRKIIKKMNLLEKEMNYDANKRGVIFSGIYYDSHKQYYYTAKAKNRLGGPDVGIDEIIDRIRVIEINGMEDVIAGIERYYGIKIK